MKRLVVHVGPPKTATTYIQKALFVNADLLSGHGVYVPTAGRSEIAHESVSHHNLGWELTGNPRFAAAQGGWDALGDELAGIDADTVLLSSEIFALAVAKGAHDALRERLLSLGVPVTVIYTVREPLAAINSGYSQQVKALETRERFGEFVESQLASGAVDLMQQTQPWRESPDFDLVAIPFPTLVESDPLVVFLDAAGIDVSTGELVTSRVPSNITLGPMAVTAFRMLRLYLERQDPTLSHDDLVTRQLWRVAVRVAKREGWCDAPFWGWTPESAAAAAEQLAESNERFAQAVWGKPWPLVMPVDRPQATLKVSELTPAEKERVHQFAFRMTRRYRKLRREGAGEVNEA